MNVRKNNGLVLNVTTKIIGKISKKDNPQTMLGVFEQKIYNKEHLIDDGSIAWLAIDRVRDPGNLGTIIRLCDWFGLSELICSKNSVDCFNAKVIQASMGSISRVKCHYVCLLYTSPSPRD